MACSFFFSFFHLSSSFLLFPAVVDDLEADKRDWDEDGGPDYDTREQCISEVVLVVFLSLNPFAQVADYDLDNGQNRVAD